MTLRYHHLGGGGIVWIGRGSLMIIPYVYSILAYINYTYSYTVVPLSTNILVSGYAAKL